MQYNVPNELIPNPRYKCTGHECPWSNYKEGIHWGLYKENGKQMGNCTLCMNKCENDPECGSLECGLDLPLPDGTVKKAHCSWWKRGTCETAGEFSTNPHNLIMTCKKQGKFKHVKINILHIITFLFMQCTTFCFPSTRISSNNNDSS